MAVITVDTADDTVANDGKTSLREALALAASAGGHTDIVLSATLPTNSPLTVQLTSRLTISGDVTIDGSSYYAGNGYGLHIVGTDLSTNLITIAAGATVTLRDMELRGVVSGSNTIAGGVGTAGLAGQNGEDGVGTNHGSTIKAENGSSGTDATDATDAGPGGAGGVAVAGIINNGTLTLERVDFVGFSAFGGTGGLGGNGGTGGTGGAGANASGPNIDGPAGNGGDGGDSGDGGRGGDGGAAVGGIYNVGTLVVRDTYFNGVNAHGGTGGHGGDSFRGGGGGEYGYSFDTTGATGGDGGDGGNGGDGGSGGLAAGAIWNVGTVQFGGVQSLAVGQLIAGTGGHYGFRGDGGDAGGYSNGAPQNGIGGIDGAGGADGVSGTAGQTGQFIGASATFGTTFTIDTPRTVISDSADINHRVVWLDIRRLGDAADTGATSVKWTFTAGEGITSSDFEGGHMPTGGVIDLSEDNDKLDYFDLYLKDDNLPEGIESFTITLSDPHGGVLGWSKSLTIYVTDEVPDINGQFAGNAPTSLKLSASSINEGSASNGKTVGSLSTTDSDKGDHFTYSLVNNAGGAFAISGSSLKVANGVALDYEQSHSKPIVVRSTDIFGNSVDKTLTVAVKDVASETVTGTSAGEKIKGGSHVDKFDGKGGNDSMSGGGGNDWFTFTSALNAITNVDHITDFSHGHDKIRLDDAVFKHLSKGTLSGSAFYTHATAHDSNDHILYDKAHGALYYDSDGKGGAAAVLFAVLDNHASLSSSDILIV